MSEWDWVKTRVTSSLLNWWEGSACCDSIEKSYYGNPLLVPAALFIPFLLTTFIDIKCSFKRYFCLSQCFNAEKMSWDVTLLNTLMTCKIIIMIMTLNPRISSSYTWLLLKPEPMKNCGEASKSNYIIIIFTRSPFVPIKIQRQFITFSLFNPFFHPHSPSTPILLSYNFLGVWDCVNKATNADKNCRTRMKIGYN